MTEQHPSGVGVRIAELRKIHGATQQALAARAKVSYSLLRKVERGERPASPSFIAAIARALGVSVLDITEQPYGVRGADPTSEQAGVPALRQALVEGDDPELETSLRSLDELRAAVAEIKEFDRRTKHAEVVQALPDVLRHLHRAVLDLTTGERPGAHDLLAAAYSYAVVALYRLGHLDLSHLADERARMAAAHGDDPLRAAVAEWNHSLILMFDGAYPAGLRSIKRADAIVDLAQPTPAVPAVRGALHLRAAIIAARATNSDLAADHLAAARSLAANGQDEANFYGTKFSLPNVCIHEVAVPVELTDGTTAVTRAAKVTLPTTTAPSRVGHYWIDLSRAWLLHGDRRQALDSLHQARRIAPQLTRYHPQVRETVHALAVQDARATGSLRNFAAWCGIRH
ncbi:MAG: helix-turn-helix domain-containing protein [Actinomycetota bacterium]|nr:helix-turn-helix domain-containing protein [Actinomycetota bacterium]